MAHTTPVQSVDAYIEHANPEAQLLLMEIRNLVKETLPEAEEVISWNQPFYKYHGYVAGFAAYKHHIRFGIVGRGIELKDRRALETKGYVVLERAVQIQYTQKLPSAELRDMMQTKAATNETKEL